MNILHDKILEHWNTFPYKLDYILHLLFSSHPNTSDIMLKEENEQYILELLRDDKGVYTSEKSATVLDLKSLFIKKEEIINMNSKSSYKTKIFAEDYVFRTAFQPTQDGSVIVLRLLGSNPNFNSFNEKMTSYSLYHKLNDEIERARNDIKKVKI